MDLYDRKIIGWSYGRNITAELATQAVKNACLNIKNTKGIILHSDLGSQYTNGEFENYLKSQGILHSFSQKGNPYDNACIESFHSIDVSPYITSSLLDTPYLSYILFYFSVYLLSYALGGKYYMILASPF